MCGLLGQIAIKGNLIVDKSKFLKCLDLIKYRGPDDKGYMFSEKVVFGHRRLSVIDLTKLGNQPMYTTDKKHSIIFNGEIYNFKELRLDLINKGYKFYNNTDTEVLLNGLVEYGIKFVKKCNGMFAFAYHNFKKNVSYIFRDRIGIKPIYYTIKNHTITFGSNVKPIYLYSNIEKDINLKSISAFFSFRQPLSNDTFFKKINTLEPGSYIEIKNNNIKIKKYWNYYENFQKNNNDKGLSYYKENLNKLLKSSIKYRLISDVNIASLLSGGLDSSIIAYEINKIVKKKFKAFSIGYKNKDYNEFKFSKLISSKFNMSHKRVFSNSEDYFDDMEKLIKLRGQPLTIPNEVSQYQLCKLIKKDATVVLSGCGADELFCGYGRIFSSVNDYKKIKYSSGSIPKNKKKYFYKNVELRYGKKNFENILEHFYTLYPYNSYETKTKFLSKDLDLKFFEKQIYSFLDQYFHSTKQKDYSNKMQFFFQNFHLKGILEREDFSSMAASVELRVPFLDHRIIEFAAKIPFKYKIKELRNDFSLTSNLSSEINDITKYILKINYNNKIPSQIINRKKVGFPVPLHTWMRDKKVKERFYTTLQSAKCINRGIFDRKYIKKLLSDNSSSKFEGSSSVYQNSVANRLWMCFNLETFFNSVS